MDISKPDTIEGVRISNEMIPHDSESIKLVKNTKGYNWEIKLRAEMNLGEAEIERLKLLNKKMELEFGEGYIGDKA